MDRQRRIGFLITTIGVALFLVALSWRELALIALSVGTILLGIVWVLASLLDTWSTRSHASGALKVLSLLLVLLIPFTAGLVLYAVDVVTDHAPQAIRLDPTWESLSTTELRAASVFLTLREQGTAAALDRLEELAAGDPELARIGPALALRVGRESAAMGRYDPAVFGTCREIFRSGCSRGVLEAVLTARLSLAGTDLRLFCDSIVDPASREACHESVSMKNSGHARAEPDRAATCLDNDTDCS